MKTIIVLALFGVLLAPQVLAGDKNKPLPAGQARVVFPVEGMTCAGCTAAIKIAVRKLDGVVAVNGDHEKGTATVTFEKGKVTAEQIVEKINKTGFKASLPETRTRKDDGS